MSSSGHDGVDPAKLRAARIKKGLVWSVLAKTWSFAVQLVSVRLLVEALGAEQYGLLEATTAFAALLALSNGGLGVGLLNRLLDAIVRKDPDDARRAVSSAILPIVGLAALLTPALGVLSALIPWERIFGAVEIVSPLHFRAGFFIALIGTLATMVGGLVNTVFNAYQETDRVRKLEVLSKGLLLVFLAALVIAKPTFPVAVAAVVAAPACAFGCGAFYLFGYHRPSLRPAFKMVDLSLFRSLVRSAGWFLLLQACHLLLFQADKAIVAAICGAPAVASYSIAQRPVLMVYAAFAFIFAPLWSAYGDAIRRRDIDWVYATRRKTLTYALAILGGGGVVYVVFNDELIALWLGREVSVPIAVVTGLCASTLGRGLVDCQSIILHSVGVFRPQVVVYVLHTAIALCLSLSLTPFIGPAAVAWSPFVASLITSMVAYPIMVKRLLANQAVPGGEIVAARSSDGSV